MNYPFRLYALSEDAITIQLPSVMSGEQVKYLFTLKKKIQAANIPSVRQITITFHEITLFYNPSILSYETLREEVQSILASKTSHPITDRHDKTYYIPVCYDESMVLDKDRLEVQSGLPFQDIISLHHQSVYQVYMMGFLPGFLYLGGLDSRLACPRLSHPRKSVAPGSVGIADQQTGIYPMESPGGWNIIGQTPLMLFNPASPDRSSTKEVNVNIQALDFVFFEPIAIETFRHIKGMSIGEYQRQRKSN